MKLRLNKVADMWLGCAEGPVTRAIEGGPVHTVSPREPNLDRVLVIRRRYSIQSTYSLSAVEHCISTVLIAMVDDELPTHPAPAAY